MPLLLLLALPAADLDAAVRTASKQWHAPGCAVVVVRDGRVTYCKGHGVRRAGDEAPVTADTLFPLSSCTKAFTSAAAALLVADGKVGWDDPARRHLPWFRLSDPLVENAVTLRDLMCHRTGLGPHELLWHRAPWGPEEAVRRLRFLPLEKPFRTAIQYQSTTFAAAGLALAEASRTSWSDLVRERLLDPLGMKQTFTRYPDAEKTGRLATGHLDGRPLPRTDPDHADPAASIYTCAADLGPWLLYQLKEGKLKETHAPQMLARLSPSQKSAFPDTQVVSYGLGWAVHDYRGRRVVSHGGSIDGFRIHLALVPEERLGVAVLCNLERSPMPLALANTLIDQQLGFPPRDWHAIYRKLDDELKATRTVPEQQHGTRPSRELAAFAGDYEHQAYDTVRVALSAGRLRWRWRGEDVPLDHYHYNTFALPGELTRDALVTFALAASGDVESFRVSGRLGVEFRKLKSQPR